MNFCVIGTALETRVLSQEVSFCYNGAALKQTVVYLRFKIDKNSKFTVFDTMFQASLPLKL